jgi:hypothetical protein
MSVLLPPDVLNRAVLSGNEYGWRVSDFPAALAAAESHGFACLGGQFEFRLSESIYEMYWLNADSTDRRSGETWADYSQRSCSEVLNKFNDLVSKTDFVREALNWGLLPSATEGLVFVAYFENEQSLAELSDTRRNLIQPT